MAGLTGEWGFHILIVLIVKHIIAQILFVEFRSTLQRYNDSGKIPKIFSNFSSIGCDTIGKLRQNAKIAPKSVATGEKKQ